MLGSMNEQILKLSSKRTKNHNVQDINRLELTSFDVKTTCLFVHIADFAH